LTAKLNRSNSAHVVQFIQKAIKEATIDCFFSPLVLKEKSEIRIKPDFNTACWSYLPPHKIFVGTGIVDKAKTELDDDGLNGYLKSFVHHEIAHAHWTERDLKTVDLELREIEVPFDLFNLFEDARIESRYRKDADFQFNWLKYEELVFTTNPVTLLFLAIQAEGDLVKVSEFIKNVDIEAAYVKDILTLKGVALNQEKPNLEAMVAFMAASALPPTLDAREKALKVWESVTTYYSRIIEASGTKDLYPLLVEWIAEFGTPSVPPPGTMEGDLALGAKLQIDAEFRAKFEAKSLPSKEPASKEELPGKGKTLDTSIANDGSVLQAYARPPDASRVSQLTQKLMKFFEKKVRSVQTMSPQRRVSARHFAVDRPYFRVKELVGKAKLKIVFQVDLSGSMDGFPINEGKILLSALSGLASSGHLEGHVLLSSGGPSRWELFKLPMAADSIARIQAFAGGEGLEDSLRANIKLMQDADYVFVYTDAQISDTPIDKASLHRHGVYTWGLFAGEAEDNHTEMQKYFDKSIIRRNAEELVEAMLSLKQ
jgi:hypothetical protein